MELVVGASEATMKSLLAKLGGLLAQEYSLIRGVHGDLQYINDELASMQSFLRDLSADGDARVNSHGHDHRMKDWMKQIRDITYDIEDCVDDSAQRLHGLRTDMCCYFLVNSVYEILTWWPRRDIGTKISNLKVRAQQIGERRQRYGVDNPKSAESTAPGDLTLPKRTRTTGFDAADNQDRSLRLVATTDPVGVEEGMAKLEKWMEDASLTSGGNTRRVLSIVGFGGVGKTRIATALYGKFRDKFDRCAIVTVSQSSDVKAIVSNIKSQVEPQTNDHDQQGSKADNRLAAAVRAVCRGASAVMAKCRIPGTSQETQQDTKLEEKIKSSYLVLIDDVWSATTWENIRKSLPESTKGSRIIVTTRFEAVATTNRREGDLVHTVKALGDTESEMLFNQALCESKGSEDVPTTSNREETDLIHNGGDKPAESSKKAISESGGSKDKAVTVPAEVWKMCGGLPLAMVTMAGHVACNPHKSRKEWLDLYSSLFPESGKDRGKDLTQEELGRIVSHCYNDMPAEIKTCSLYLSIFPKGHKISRKRLTRRWIAEGFVSEKQGLSVEDVAETYFNHLIRRKMIRPVEHSSNGKVKNCIVHDMVLEHIVAKAGEENFITVVGGHWLMHLPSSKVRRLSLHGSESKHANDTEKMNLSHVRSLTMFESLNQLPSHSFKFEIVQVLDLEGCKGFKQHHTKEICKMLLLKYLSLRGTDIKRLPRTIGKLGNLETLDVRETHVVELPKTVCQLERLVNILGGNKRTRKALKLVEWKKKKKMKALRTLSGIEIVGGSADLHHLTELRKLAIYKLNMEDDASFEILRSSIGYLGGYALQTLVIYDETSKFLKSLDDLSSPPKFLVALELSGKIVQLPEWITELDALNKLTLSVTAFRTDNLRQLSKLKALFSLTFSLSQTKRDSETLTILAKNKLHSDGEIQVPSGGFEKLKLLRFSAPLLPLLGFTEKAMPELERLELRFNMLEGIFGAENLAGLKEVHLKLDDKEGEVRTWNILKEMESAMKREDAKGPRVIHNLTAKRPNSN